MCCPVRPAAESMKAASVPENVVRMICAVIMRLVKTAAVSALIPALTLPAERMNFAQTGAASAHPDINSATEAAYQVLLVAAIQTAEPIRFVPMAFAAVLRDTSLVTALVFPIRPVVRIPIAALTRFAPTEVVPLLVVIL